MDDDEEVEEREPYRLTPDACLVCGVRLRGTEDHYCYMHGLPC